MTRVLALLLLPGVILAASTRTGDDELENFSVVVKEIPELTCALEKLELGGDTVLSSDEQSALFYALEGIGRASYTEVITFPGAVPAAGSGCSVQCAKGSCFCSGGKLCACWCGIGGSPRCGGSRHNLQAPQPAGGEP